MPNNSATNITVEDSLISDILNLNYDVGEVYLLNQELQATFIILIILFAVVANLAVIHNVCLNDLKMKSVNFILIKNLCIVDLVGAICVLPIPLAATIKGVWDFGSTVCAINSVVNVTVWFQHLALFGMLKIDRVLASCLPIGKYPLLPVKAISILVLISWILSFSIAGLVTGIFHSSYEPAVVLCIPELPIEFFITIFSIYCLVLFSMVTSYIGVLFYLKKKQAHSNRSSTTTVLDYRGLEHAALTSFLITMSHFLLYVPTMLVIGLHGWFLHPVAILLCDMIVYSEFLIHPTVLLFTSTKLREEISNTIRKSLKNTGNLAIDFICRRRSYCCCISVFVQNNRKCSEFPSRLEHESKGAELNEVADTSSSFASSVVAMQSSTSIFWISSSFDCTSSRQRLSEDKRLRRSLPFAQPSDGRNQYFHKIRRHSFHSTELKNILKDVKRPQTPSNSKNHTEFDKFS
nr:pinopsin-like [Lepeophtheirus salmonis]XP_040565038.1 pinopsin-like [Lepeophtheirus salmonis]